MVKANAYGLGLEPVTAALAKAGCKTFFVADLAEARRVRTRARDASIYVLDGCTPEGSPAFVELNARPVINSMTELAEVIDLLRASQAESKSSVAEAEQSEFRCSQVMSQCATLQERLGEI